MNYHNMCASHQQNVRYQEMQKCKKALKNGEEYTPPLPADNKIDEKDGGSGRSRSRAKYQ